MATKKQTTKTTKTKKTKKAPVLPAVDDDAAVEALVACLVDYAGGGYVPTLFANPSCRCAPPTRLFKMLIDDEVGVAVRICATCDEEHGIGDAEEYFDEAAPGECACPCGGELFTPTIGLATYDDGVGLRWVSVGLRCAACGLVACYGDWKNEHDDVMAWADNA